MLAALSIRDVVLIERLALSLNAGLCVLTGETGAGKSILLDALGLALGSRGDSTLVRHGSDQASVTAEFDLPDDHPAIAMVREQGLGGRRHAGAAPGRHGRRPQPRLCQRSGGRRHAAAPAG